MSLEKRYKTHRKIRYILALPMVFIFGWWVYGMTWTVLLSLQINLYLQVAISLLIAITFVLFVFKYLYKRYKIFLYSRLFIKNPSLSIFMFTIENLSLIILYFGFLLSYLIGGLTNNSAIIIVVPFIITPICIGTFVISYIFNERKEKWIVWKN